MSLGPIHTLALQTIIRLGGKMLRRYTTVLLLLSSLLFSSPGVGAQAQQEKVDADAIAKIRDEGLKHSQVMNILSYLTDVSGPRLTGSPNIKSAQEWARGKLSQWGLQNVHLEA